MLAEMHNWLVVIGLYHKRYAQLGISIEKDHCNFFCYDKLQCFDKHM